jgi:hypothetical protein
LSTLFEYWGNVGRNSVARLEAASAEIQDRKYGSEKLMSDVLGAWMDGVEGWWSALLSSVSPTVPTVFFRLTEGLTKAKNASVPISVPGAAQPGWTDLVRLGGTQDQRIPRENVNVAINQARNALEVSLVGLGQVHPQEGNYQGMAYIEERPLATIQVLVSR